MSQNDLITNLYFIICDLYNNYKDSKNMGNSNSENKDHLLYNGNSILSEKESKENINFKSSGLQNDWALPLNPIKNISPIQQIHFILNYKH
jgi:hypothetical protein